MKQVKRTFIHTAEELYKLQKTSYKAKQKSDFYVPMYDFLISSTKADTGKVDTDKRLDYANGIVSKEVYDAVLKELNVDKFSTKLSEIPLVDDVDIITPIIQRYIGEYLSTPNIYHCTLESSDVAEMINTKTREHISKIVQAKLISRLSELGAQMNKQPGNDSQAMVEAMKNMDIPAEIEKIKKEIYNKEAKKSKDILDFFLRDNKVESHLAQQFFYFISTLEVYSVITPMANKLDIEFIPPSDYFRFNTTNSIFVEDDAAGVMTKEVSYKEILDLHEGELTKEDKAYLSTLIDSFESGKSITISQRDILARYDGGLTGFIQDKWKGSKDDKLSPILTTTQYTLFFQTKRKVGILTTTNQLTGEPTTLEVDEYYKLNPDIGDIEIEYIWVDEVWKGYRYGEGTGIGIYIKPSPLPIQRNELSDLPPKLPVIGIDGLLTDMVKKGLGEKVINQQALYIILTFKIRQEISKFKGFFNLIPESLLNDSKEFTQAKRLELLYKDSLLLFNDEEVDVNILQALRAVGNLSSVGEYILSLYQIRDNIKREAWEQVNMNSERYDGGDTRGAVTNVQEAIRRVSTGSVLLFTMFDIFKELLYQAVSDYGRMSYIDGISSNLTDTRNNVTELNYSYDELLNRNIGVFVSTNKLEHDKFVQLRQLLLQSAVQSGESELAISSITTDNAFELKAIASKLREATTKREQELQQMKSSADKELEGIKKGIEDAKNKTKLSDTQLKGEYDLALKMKDVYVKLLEIKMNSDNAVETNESDVDKELKYLDAEIKKSTIRLNNAKLKDMSSNSKKS